jgi:transposase
MVTIGIDPHKRTHTAVAVDQLGRELAAQTVSARQEGFGQLMIWAHQLDERPAWVIEDCRHVSGPLERFLLDHGQTVVRLPPRLMAGARQSSRQRGKSDPIDALAIARTALREGLDTLPTARLSGPELDIRQLLMHRQRLVDSRTALINELRWQLHDLWPEWEIPGRALDRAVWQTRVQNRLSRAEQTARVRIARDEIRRIKDLTQTINQLAQEISGLVEQVAPQLLTERGLGILTAAKLIGEIAGIDRFTSDAQLARLAGCAPIPVSSGQSNRHRLDPGGNRQLNNAFYTLAINKLRHDPRTAVYVAKQRAQGKTQRDAIRSLKRHLVRRVYRLLKNPNNVEVTICLT